MRWRAKPPIFLLGCKNVGMTININNDNTYIQRDSDCNGIEKDYNEEQREGCG